MSLTPEQAHAAAEAYGWSVLSHDNGGFFAQRGEYRMIVTFDERGVFRHASVREGFDGLRLSLLDTAVIGQLASHGAGRAAPGGVSR